MEPIGFSVARWVGGGWDAVERAQHEEKLHGVNVVQDRFGRPVCLFRNAWKVLLTCPNTITSAPRHPTLTTISPIHYTPHTPTTLTTLTLNSPYLHSYIPTFLHSYIPTFPTF